MTSPYRNTDNRVSAWQTFSQLLSAMGDDTRWSRDADANEVSIKHRMCALLGIDQAALSNEGFVAHSPDRVDLLAALYQASDEPVAPTLPSTWGFVSNRKTTVDAIVSAGALGTLVDANSAADFEYPGFFPTSE